MSEPSTVWNMDENGHKVGKQVQLGQAGNITAGEPTPLYTSQEIRV